MCAAVRYRVTGPLRDVVGCHCSQCRRMTGHFMAATAARLADFALLADTTLRWYAASAEARRGFCAACGSTLFWAGNGQGLPQHCRRYAGRCARAEVRLPHLRCRPGCVLPDRARRAADQGRQVLAADPAGVSAAPGRVQLLPADAAPRGALEEPRWSDFRDRRASAGGRVFRSSTGASAARRSTARARSRASRGSTGSSSSSKANCRCRSRTSPPWCCRRRVHPGDSPGMPQAPAHHWPARCTI